MTYSFENLGADRFQELCQAVLTTEFKDVQCLPTGQPDGGRDALISSTRFQVRKDGVVFQVKFSKNPSSKDERQVIEELIASESAKVDQLRENGLKRYYLLTNVAGTSHLDTGSIDRVNDALSEAFEVPSFCWWRDDLDRRIDANSSIKWSFPDIIRGSDVLQVLYEGRFGNEEERRLSAIRAYLAYQHKYDSQLKFKQVDLEKGLVDLFVDVPAAAVSPSDTHKKAEWFELYRNNPTMLALIGHEGRFHSGEEVDRIGAVKALVDPTLSVDLPRIVVEGAPGQGKSTVTQYLCQLHRIFLLQKVGEISKIPDELRPQDVRLPLRVDLRDYATWLAGRSPFQDANSKSLSEGYSPSLESFLAAQISAQSGGLRFSPDDLLAFAANSSLLIVLDGFDEVADIDIRNKLVREISDASTRFDGNSIANQVIVTSRPAAFANSPGFPRDEWQYIQILPLTKSVISIYADKWMSGHNLNRRERQEIQEVLDEKLSYPHVRELARNPMQLAILLALISTQGASLPDKRTTLYDRYIDIFFNREAEKSKVVRDKRELLIDMHRYLAWRLQVEAESDAKAGNISEDRLREVLRSYLRNLGHDASLVDDLFVGMVERVVALVSRVQGTFEFEVQPLREYFAARFLYDTAPHIQAGSDRSGSIMDRFDALARNAYWLNVTRFYCGCYSTGELPSLIDGLIGLGQSKEYAGTSYVNDLALTLLSDFVFSQQPRSINRLSEDIFAQDRFRLILANSYSSRDPSSVQLPEECGQEHLRTSAVHEYNNAHHFDVAFASAEIIKANIGSESRMRIWREARSDFSADRAVHFGSFLEVIEELEAQELLDLIDEGGENALRVCIYQSRTDVMMLRPSLWRDVVELCLDSRTAWLAYRTNEDEGPDFTERSINLILTMLGALSTLQRDDEDHRGRTILENALRYGPSIDYETFVISENEIEEEKSWLLGTDIISQATRLFELEMKRSSALEAEAGSFFDKLVSRFGLRTLTIDAALAVFQWFEEGYETIRYTQIFSELAEIKFLSNSLEWWKKIFDEPGEKSLLYIKAYFLWVDSNNLAESLAEFSSLVDELPTSEFRSIYASASMRHHPFPRPSRELLEPNFGPDSSSKMGYKAAALLYSYLGAKSRDAIYEMVLSKYDGDDEDINDARVTAAWQFAMRNPTYWSSALPIIAQSYTKGAAIDHFISSSNGDDIPETQALEITQKPRAYPLSVLGAAQKVLSARIGSKAVPVGEVAEKNDWFAD